MELIEKGQEFYLEKSELMDELKELIRDQLGEIIILRADKNQIKYSTWDDYGEEVHSITLDNPRLNLAERLVTSLFSPTELRVEITNNSGYNKFEVGEELPEESEDEKVSLPPVITFYIGKDGGLVDVSTDIVTPMDAEWTVSLPSQYVMNSLSRSGVISFSKGRNKVPSRLKLTSIKDRYQYDYPRNEGMLSKGFKDRLNMIEDRRLRMKRLRDPEEFRNRSEGQRKSWIFSRHRRMMLSDRTRGSLLSRYHRMRNGHGYNN